MKCDHGGGNIPCGSPLSSPLPVGVCPVLHVGSGLRRVNIKVGEAIPRDYRRSSRMAVVSVSLQIRQNMGPMVSWMQFIIHTRFT
ncbi:hypothetical protein XELAEV_18006042mg [Xenopus laevis]|uniref:Uncharacterized protein n=1 Tax=Xenopus laevis TaxID=8355 RepID=A0A974DZ70_XENLA|nr:hypothetical protein XELAEV_18006042mg [Xenopus laevis]